MKTKLLGMVSAAVLLAASAIPASAAVKVISLGMGAAGDTLSLPSNQSISASATPFVIDYTFSLTSFAALTDAAFSLTSDKTTAAGSNTFELYSGVVGSGTFVTNGAVATGVPGFPKVVFEGISSELLTSGNYYFESKGVYNPAGGGTLSVGGSVTLSAVPEVSTWAMMFLGFAALGFAGFRSRRSVDLSA